MDVIDEGKANRHVAVTSKHDVVFPPCNLGDRYVPAPQEGWVVRSKWSNTREGGWKTVSWTQTQGYVQYECVWAGLGKQCLLLSRKPLEILGETYWTLINILSLNMGKQPTRAGESKLLSLFILNMLLFR